MDIRKFIRSLTICRQAEIIACLRLRNDSNVVRNLLNIISAYQKEALQSADGLLWLTELEARGSDYARKTQQPETRHRLTVFTVSEIQLNIFDGGFRECCAVHNIAYCMQTFGAVGRNIYYTVQNIVELDASCALGYGVYVDASHFLLISGEGKPTPSL